MVVKTSSPKAVQKLALKKGLLAQLENVYYLTIKELRSIRADYMVLILVAYVFTVSIYTIATGVSTEPQNLTVGIVDEDQSNLSRQFLDVLNRPPLFKRAVLVNANEIDPIMNAGRMIFRPRNTAPFRRGPAGRKEGVPTIERRRYSDGTGRERRCLYPDHYHAGNHRFPGRPSSAAALPGQYRDTQ